MSFFMSFFVSFSLASSCRWTVFTKYWYEILGIPCDFEIENRRNRLRFKYMKFTLGTVFKCSAGRVLFNGLFKFNQRIQQRREEATTRKLQKRFPEEPYSRCPYDINLDDIDGTVI